MTDYFLTWWDHALDKINLWFRRLIKLRSPHALNVRSFCEYELFHDPLGVKTRSCMFAGGNAVSEMGMSAIARYVSDGMDLRSSELLYCRRVREWTNLLCGRLLS
jgi:hypothetical protein